MKNFRIPVMGLATCALLFTSCAKTITKEEAIKFVEENYTSKEEKTPTKMIAEFSGNGSDEETRTMIAAMGNELGYGFKLDKDKLNDRTEKTDGLEPMSVVTTKYIEGLATAGYEFKAKGKELIASYKMDLKDTSGEGYMYTEYTTTSEGRLGKQVNETNAKNTKTGQTASYKLIVTYEY